MFHDSCGSVIMDLETYVFVVVVVFFAAQLVFLPAGMIWISRSFGQETKLKYPAGVRIRSLFMNSDRLRDSIDNDDLSKFEQLRRRYRLVLFTLLASIAVLIIALLPAITAPIWMT